MKGVSGVADPLGESSQYVKGVGPARQEILSRLGIETVGDLLGHYPRTWYDRSDPLPLAGAEPGSPATVAAGVLAAATRRTRNRRSVTTVVLGDETGTVDLVFFNQPYLEKTFQPGARVIASGTVGRYRGRRQMIAPEFEIADPADDGLVQTGRIVPVYPLTAGLSGRTMRRIVRAALDKCAGRIGENLPRALVAAMGFPPRGEAFLQIHYPDDRASLDAAVRRFKFEEVFFLHLLLRGRRERRRAGRPRPALSPPHTMLDRFLHSLPFDLTAAQERVLDEIRRDIERPEGLSRLLQGDVGSGKTIVGLAALTIALGRGYQGAFMVPTEILAQQHAEKADGYLGGLGIRTALLIGSMPAGEKRRVREGLADGSIDLVVGTHAIIQEATVFRQLGLAVVDEQHRFGVRQRATLGRGELLPHFLVMTATPIPRSLAQTVYGDLDLSLIDELPFGRRRVYTEIVPRRKRNRVFDAVRAAFRDGRQAFFLYPLVEESEKSDLTAATDAFERLQSGELDGFPIGLLHGRMSFEEKSAAIRLFREGRILGLVTTTVIEVGVDVPNASILVIEHPERFGLAQLHQLRGRVGRGGEAGACYLLAGEEVGGRSAERLAWFAANDDGFAIAEKDLEMRGPGEIWGYRQSGVPAFRLINPLSDRDLVLRSWEEAGRMIAEDPQLGRRENAVVSEYFRRYYRPRMALAEIG
ncbi:MAG: ATP-dependent DNA helicase RecG [Candidatus Krumholzibacteriota bacterium]|nr:ATP-dependent DNA helicase RecG [Candidatus Krumholzibacteriota bacterium]